ncbi:arylesterase precursor [Aquitalea magnusonii]|jgi:acyl-CoA thioesterase-1|uniref:Arylesterase n=1 Tax=Aquitalea magnusonii TaxID=332411 RepID=A0A3G9GH24_9NEIS|nr:arylesterase [Aquitalea magnusonii]BBF86775.1 arylesterase precursor [Aquitalea magnusonii]
MSSAMVKLVCILFAGWLALPASAATILVMGDSLSAGYGLAPGQGWVSLLQQDLEPKHRIINASISGETSDGGLARLPDALRRHKPDIVVLELGANDGLRGLPLAGMERNLQQMITLSRQASARVVLVGMALPSNYGPQYTAEFRAVYDRLAKRNQLSYVPLLLVGFATDISKFQPDGLHPVASVQATMMRTVKAKLPLK